MLRLQLFGPPLIEWVGQPLTQFKSRKVEALLFYLSLTPGRHPRQHLATLLWSEWPEDRALSNLRFALWNLRQLLPPSLFTVDQLTITLEHNDIWVDVQEFWTCLERANHSQNGLSPELVEDLQRAADLYQGDFLTGCDLSQAPVFDEWLQQQRTALRELALDNLARLSTYYTTHRHWPQAIATTQRLLDLDPWQEAAQRQMMSLLALTGRRSAALDHYRHSCEILAADLDLDPEPETVALMEQIRAGQLQPEERFRPTAPAEIYSKKMPFFGRHTEYAWLVEQWQRAKQGRSILALLRGEAGVGKTRLVEEVGQNLASLGQILLWRGRCYEFSVAVPYQPIATALRQHLIQFEAKNVSFSATWLAELAQLVPEIREQYPDLPPPLITDQQTDYYRLFEAIAQFIQTTSAQQPVLLFLDDLQWADTATLDMLGYIMRRLTVSPLLVIGTYRPDLVLDEHPLLTLQESLACEGVVETLDLPPLSKEAVSHIIEAMTPEPDVDRLSSFLYQMSHGNPFFLLETIVEIQEQGWLRPLRQVWNLDPAFLAQPNLIPAKVHLRIRRQVARLSPESQHLLALAAVIGQEFDTKLLQAASGTSLEIVLDCLDDWLARHLVTEIAGFAEPPASATGSFVAVGRYDFSHDLKRAVVYHGLSQARRQALHGQIAAALEQRCAGQLEQVVDLLAYHYHHSGDSAKALPYLQQVGQQAKSVYALPLALTHFQQALAHWERLYHPANGKIPPTILQQRWDLLLSQAEVSYNLGQPDKQRLILEMVSTEIARWGTEQDRLLMISEQLVYPQQTLELGRRRDLARQGMDLAHALNAPLPEGRCLQALGDCDRDAANYQQALIYYQAALAIFSQLPETRQATFCLINIGRTHTMYNHFAQALTALKQAEIAARTGQHQDILIWSLIHITYTYLLMGSLEQAQTTSKETLALCAETGLQPMRSLALMMQGRVDMLMGHLAQAQANYKQALSLSQAMGQTLRVSDVECCLGYLWLFEQHNPAQALGHLERAWALCGQVHSGRRIKVLSYQAMAQLGLGQLELALTYSQQAVAWLKERGNCLEAGQKVYLGHYQVLLAQGQVEAAQTALQEAHRMVTSQIAHLPAPDLIIINPDTLQHQFLTRLPWNREIMTALEKGLGVIQLEK